MLTFAGTELNQQTAREAIKNWTENQHYSAWRDLPGHRHGKLFIGRPCKKRKELMTCLG
jgi:hypothetical protein